MASLRHHFDVGGGPGCPRRRSGCLRKALGILLGLLSAFSTPCSPSGPASKFTASAPTRPAVYRSCVNPTRRCR